MSKSLLSNGSMDVFLCGLAMVTVASKKLWNKPGVKAGPARA